MKREELKMKKGFQNLGDIREKEKKTSVQHCQRQDARFKYEMCSHLKVPDCVGLGVMKSSPGDFLGFQLFKR